MQDKVYALIKQRVEDDIEISDSSEFFRDLGLSSLDMATLIFAVEDEIGKKINVMDKDGW